MADRDLLWANDLLWAKSLAYVQRALGESRDSGLFPFWASLALELLARSTLAYISPVLLADLSDRDGRNVLYAVGQTPKIRNFVPRSIGAREVFAKCEQLVPEFTTDSEAFCKGLANRRNEELHSGGLPFEDFPNRLWIHRFYEISEQLLNFQGKNLVDWVDADEAAAAYQLIEAAKDETAKKVGKQIAAHKEVWERKNEPERKELAHRAKRQSRPHLGHIVACPSCSCPSVLTGEEIRHVPPRLEDDELVVREEILPTGFSCIACGLSMEGHAQLHAAELGGVFTNTIRYDPLEYYAEEAVGDDYFNE